MNVVNLSVDSEQHAKNLNLQYGVESTNLSSSNRNKEFHFQDQTEQEWRSYKDAWDNTQADTNKPTLAKTVSGF